VGVCIVFFMFIHLCEGGGDLAFGVLTDPCD
jgi:hypothetical protein